MVFLIKIYLSVHIGKTELLHIQLKSLVLLIPMIYKKNFQF